MCDEECVFQAYKLQIKASQQRRSAKNQRSDKRQVRWKDQIPSIFSSAANSRRGRMNSKLNAASCLPDVVLTSASSDDETDISSPVDQLDNHIGIPDEFNKQFLAVPCMRLVK